MTEREGKALAARLTRIWAPEEVWDSIPAISGRYLFYAPINPSVYMELQETGELALYFRQGHDEVGCLYVHRDGEIAILASEDDEEYVGELAAQWLAQFRRGCWLSGCPIEASTHEKAEWMQGFSAEEIEAWDLKL